MFDFDAGKLLIIGVIALIVIGPKELPRVLRQVGQTVGRLRRMATEFQGQFMDAMKEADIESIKEEMNKISRDSALDVNFDPARDIQAELTRSLDQPAPPEPAAVMVEAASPAAAFTLPPPEPVVEEGEVMTLASAGPAPAIDAEASEHAPVPDQPVPSPLPPPLARKRKIIQRKRQPLRARAPHAVSDRTRAGTALRVRLKAMEP